MPHAAVDSVWPPLDLTSKAVGEPVRNVDVQALGGGDNFASATLKVQATTDQGQVCEMIVKRPPPAALDEFYPIRPAFEVEGRMYEEVLPRMNKLLRSVGKDSPPLAPRILLRMPEPDPALFFEDISVEGFRMASREEGLDVEHCRLVLRSLARFHAAGAVLLETQASLVQDMPRMICEEHARFIDGLLVKGLARLLKHAEKWPDQVSQRVSAKLRQLEPTARQRILDAHCPAPLGKAFNVILHGDLWSGNVLFKYAKNGKPVDVRLIDFQLSTWGSPASDIMYFFPTASGEARGNRNELLVEYHAELTACLKAMKARHVPDLSEFMADIRRRGMVEVMHTTSSTPLVCAPHSLGIIFENLIDDHTRDGPHPRDVAIQRQPLQRLMKQFFAAWEQEGVLDELLQQEQYR